MTSDEIAPRYELMRVLTLPPIWKIDFSFGSIHVDGAGFFSVVWALMYRRIEVRIGSTSAAGAAAEYHPENNEYVFPFKAAALTPRQKATIVRESVHAMNDIRAGKQYPKVSLLQTENEASAYVAEALYLLHTVDGIGAGDGASAYWDKAFEVANKIKNAPGARVDAEDAQYIKHASRRRKDLLQKIHRIDSCYF